MEETPPVFQMTSLNVRQLLKPLKIIRDHPYENAEKEEARTPIAFVDDPLDWKRLASTSPSERISRKGVARLKEISQKKKERQRILEETRTEVDILNTMQGLLTYEVILKMSYSENYVDFRRLIATLDRLRRSIRHQRREVILLVPTLVKTLLRLNGNGIGLDVRSKVKGVLTDLCKVVFPDSESFDLNEICSKYFAESSKALVESPNLDPTRLMTKIE